MCLVMFSTVFALAQRDLGTITGTVTDPTGAVVPGASITITEDATGQSYKVQTSAAGDYVRPALKPGTYTVAAEAPGFRRIAQRNVIVTAGQRTGVPLALAVGELTESVMVTSEAPLLQSESTTLGASLSSGTVSAMPLGGQRVFTYLARLSPGVVPAEQGARDSNSGGFSANGVRSNGQNNFLLNGVDNNVNVIDFMNGTSFVIGPPPEAIGEMQVLTSGYNAEYGRAAGGVVNVNLKTGTNALHGDLWEVFKNDKLNANSWSNNRLAKPRPVYKQNQFGVALGGPIIKNRFFIFGDYQGTRIANIDRSGLVTIPTQKMTTGDFSGILGGNIGTSALGSAILQYQIYDPATTRKANGQDVRDPFTGNKIPSNRFDPAAAKIMKLFPAENQAVTGFPLNDYYYSGFGSTQVDGGDLRADFRISEQDSLYGSLSWTNKSVIRNTPLPGALDAGGFSGASQEDLTRNAQLGYTRVWSPSVITESRIAFTRLVSARAGPSPEVDQYATYGIGGYNPTSALPMNGGLPFISVSRYLTFGAAEWLPTLEYSNVLNFVQNLSIIRGSHAFKVGVEFRPVQFPFMQYPDPRGRFDFNQNGTAYPSTAKGSTGLTLNSNTGDSMASFLLGQVDTGRVSTTNFISSMKKSYAFYAQDDWKVTRKLTLNIGLRYELFSPSYEKFGQQANFVWSNLTLYIPKGKNQDKALPPNFGTAFPNVKVSRGEVSKYMFPWDKWDFGPRIGLAYNVLPKTVLRAGFGIFYGGEENQGGSPNLGFSAPFNYTVRLERVDKDLKPIGLFDTNPWFSGGFASGLPLSPFTLPAQMDFRGFAMNYRNPMVQKWNFAIQRELPWQTALELAYVGNKQLHQNVQHTANAPVNLGTTDSKITAESRRMIPYIGGGSVTDTFGYGNYNALTAKLEKRLSGGVEFITSYTWGHAFSNSNTPLSGGTSVFDPHDFSTGYSNALWDIRHNFTTGFTYEVPIGRGRRHGASFSPAVNHILGGWALNGILTLRTGRPVTLSYNGCQGVWFSCRPDIVAGKNANGAPAAGRSAEQWFDKSAVAAAAPLTGGNAGAYNMRAPGNNTLDTSLFKTFQFSERVRVEFRLEAFNLFNTTQLGGPDMAFQNSTFATITSSSGERNAQVSLRLHF